MGVPPSLPLSITQYLTLFTGTVSGQAPVPSKRPSYPKIPSVTPNPDTLFFPLQNCQGLRRSCFICWLTYLLSVSALTARASSLLLSAVPQGLAPGTTQDVCANSLAASFPIHPAGSVSWASQGPWFSNDVDWRWWPSHCLSQKGSPVFPSSHRSTGGSPAALSPQQPSGFWRALGGFSIASTSAPLQGRGQCAETRGTSTTMSHWRRSLPLLLTRACRFSFEVDSFDHPWCHHWGGKRVLATQGILFWWCRDCLGVGRWLKVEWMSLGTRTLLKLLRQDVLFLLGGWQVMSSKLLMAMVPP